MARPKNEPVVHTVTSASTSSTDDQDQRVRKYLTMMGIRVACFGLVFVTTGWVRWVAVAGAVLIPYFAVVIANAVGPAKPGRPEAVTPPVDHTERIEQ